jgi:hypothetical protein
MRIARRSPVARSHAEIGDFGLHPLLALPLVSLDTEDDIDRTARIQLRQPVCGTPRNRIQRASCAAEPHFDAVV